MAESDPDTAAEWPVLVPVEILEGETIPEALIELFASLPVVVLGYHVLPEQTPPGQARVQFEERAQTKLRELVEAFGAADGTADSRLVFTHDEEQTIERIANETGCKAILIPNPTTAIERILLPVGEDIDIDRLAAFVTRLIGDRAITVTPFSIAETDDPALSTARDRLEATKTRLRALGLDEQGIEPTVETDESSVDAISTAATDHDVVVMSESEPSLESFLFGPDAERIAERSLGPVVIVRSLREVPTSAADKA